MSRPYNHYTKKEKKKANNKYKNYRNWRDNFQIGLGFRSFIGVLSGLLTDNFTVILGALWGRWRPGVQFTFLFLLYLVRHEILVLLPQKPIVNLTMLSPNVEEDFFNTLVISIVVPNIVILRGLVLLRLLELMNSLMFGLQLSSFPRGNLTLNDLAKFVLSCLNFLL